MTKEELEKEAEDYRKEKLKERKVKFVFELPEVYVTDIKQAYLAGAEPREKRISELEKENAELEWQLQEVAKDNDLYQKENAELKSGCGMCYRKDKEQLTKAKELLKQFLEAKNGEDTYKAEWEAEQFLNSEVVK